MINDTNESKSTINSDEYINSDSLKQLIADTSLEMAHKITDLYFEEMRKRGETLKNNLDDHDVIGKEAHAIKSSSATIGAAKTAELAMQIDHLYKQEHYDQLANLITPLLECMTQTEALFADHMDSL